MVVLSLLKNSRKRSGSALEFRTSLIGDKLHFRKGVQFFRLFGTFRDSVAQFSVGGSGAWDKVGQFDAEKCAKKLPCQSSVFQSGNKFRNSLNFNDLQLAENISFKTRLWHANC